MISRVWAVGRSSVGEDKEGRMFQIQETAGACWGGCIPRTGKRREGWSKEWGWCHTSEAREGGRRPGHVSMPLPCLEFPVVLGIVCEVDLSYEKEPLVSYGNKAGLKPWVRPVTLRVWSMHHPQQKHQGCLSQIQPPKSHLRPTYQDGISGARSRNLHFIQPAMFCCNLGLRMMQLCLCL